MKKGSDNLKKENPSLVLDWLRECFQVKENKEINPWAKHPVATHSPGKEVFITARCGSQNFETDMLVITNEKSAEEQKLVCTLGDSDRTNIDHAPTSLLPRTPFLNPMNQRPLKPDLNKVSVFSVVARHAINTVPRQMGLRLNFSHSAMDAVQGTSDREDLQQVMGAPRGVFYNIPPSTPKEGIDVKSFAMHTMDHHYTNVEFVRTMAYVTKDNLMNGILHLPRDLCIAAGLDVYTGPPAPPVKLNTEAMAEYEKTYIEQYKKSHGHDPPHHWVAIPYNHVLSWGWHMDAITRRDVFNYTIVDLGVDGQRLYFLVQDGPFTKKIASFKRFWMNKVEFQQLSSIGVEFVPILNVKSAQQGPSVVSGISQVTLHIGYMTFPHMTPSIIAGLAPTMTSNFPAFGQGRAALVMAQKSGNKFGF